MTNSTSISSTIRCATCDKPAGWVCFVPTPTPGSVVRASCKDHDDVYYWFTLADVAKKPDWIVRHLAESKRPGVAEAFVSWFEEQYGSDNGLREHIVRRGR